MSDDKGTSAEPSDELSQLLFSRDVSGFANAWLGLQCQRLGQGVNCGLVVLGTPDQGPFAPVAIWPTGVLGSPLLVKSVESSISQRKPITNSGSRPMSDRQGESRIDVVALPVVVDGMICGAAAIEIIHTSTERLAEIQELLRLGLGWLEAFVRRSHTATPDRLVTVLDLVATGLHHDRFQVAATAVATDMARVLGCERVSVGFLSGQQSRLLAMSNSAAFGNKSNEVRAIEASMDEAIDQQSSIVYPLADKDSIQLVRAHKTLSEDHKADCICTIPMAGDSVIFGALVFERQAGQPFDKSTVELCEHIAKLLGPLLEAKRREDRWIARKAWDSLANLVRKLIGPRQTALKLVTGMVIVTLLLLTFVHADYRVTADARLEGEIQRSVSAPLSGYIADASFRAGDVVSKGDVLFTLDDRELWLERLRAGGEQVQYTREYNDAVARRDRAESRVLSARIKQADAQIELIEEQLARTRVTAPFDAVIVTGDLSQSLGAPVERGDVLFQVAPLDSYRVILKVDERDVSDVNVGQIGTLVLSSHPNEKLMIEVTKVTPVAIAAEGTNYFVIEAQFSEGPSQLLRPGMEGVGKVNIEPRRLIWIWTYKIVHWVRMFVWSWWP
jgi:RND family efflux transporter MFP subunit